MALLNYSTAVAAEKTAGEIVSLLAKQGASQVMMDYDGKGGLTSISWRINTPSGVLPFRLPIDVEATKRVLRRQWERGQLERVWHERKGQPERVAWRVVKAWVQAQLALLETEMVTLDQLFLPYMLVAPDESLYQRINSPGGLQALTGPVD